MTRHLITKEETCPTCDGDGWIDASYFNEEGREMIDEKQCSLCQAEGVLRDLVPITETPYKHWATIWKRAAKRYRRLYKKARGTN